jgi:polyhydroxyalkanoate depolymerase
MAGPIDARVNETAVNKTATKNSMRWFENLTTEVSEKYAGAKRKVYPGFVQLFSFMAMNPQRHIDAHKEMFNDLCKGDSAKARKKIDFYDEYLATEDMTAEFYLETVSKVFQKFELALGKMKWRGETIDPGAIRTTALLTVEGGEDDICGRGQTEAAQVLCTGLKSDQKYHYVQPGAGHYGVFSGRRWQNEIAPRFSKFIRDIAERKNVAYTPPATESQVYQGPDKWDPARMVPELGVLHDKYSDNRQQKQPGGPSVLIG